MSHVLAVRPGSARAWVLAARPSTLTAAVSPVLVGTACAYAEHRFRPGPALAALIGAMLLQIGSNLANDVFDHEKGADTEERLGPLRTAQAGLLTPRQLRAGMAIVFALALAIGAYLTAVAGPAIVVIGLSSIAAAIAYTGGPYPLGYHGLGDLFVMLFFGFVAVCGTAFVQTGHVSGLAIASSIPVGAIATAILVVNNVRDCETDVKAGKRTVPVRFGRRTGVIEYATLMAVAQLVPVVLAASGVASYWVLNTLFAAPQSIRLARTVATQTGRDLNATLVATAKLLFAYAFVFATGLSLTSAR